MEYAVRGPLVIRATEIEKEIQNVRYDDEKAILALLAAHVKAELLLLRNDAFFM